MNELKRRYLVRGAIMHWRGWTARMKKAREDAIRDREETFDRLGLMGLGGVVPSVDAQAMEAAEAESESHQRMEEFEVDVALHQVRRIF